MSLLNLPLGLSSQDLFNNRLRTVSFVFLDWTRSLVDQGQGTLVEKGYLDLHTERVQTQGVPTQRTIGQRDVSVYSLWNKDSVKITQRVKKKKNR